MTQSKILPAIIVLIVLELVNTAVNILPALKEPTAAGRTRRLIRAGIFNFILLAGFVAYLVLGK